MEDIIQCSICKYGKMTYTRMLGGASIPEWYCKLNGTYDYCSGDDFIEDD